MMTGLGIIILFLIVVFLSNFNFASLAHLGIFLFTVITGLAADMAKAKAFVSTPDAKKAGRRSGVRDGNYWFVE